MHELAITENLIEIAIEEGTKNDLVSINEIKVVIGRMHQLVPDLLYFAFETATENTIARHARLEIEWVPIEMQCHDCGKIFTIEDILFICQDCGSSRLTQLKGKELYVKSIEGTEYGNHHLKTGS